MPTDSAIIVTGVVIAFLVRRNVGVGGSLHRGARQQPVGRVDYQALIAAPRIPAVMPVWARGPQPWPARGL